MKSHPQQHPERFGVDYILEADSEAEARRLAWEVCLEQTVELPSTLEQVKDVESYVVGSIERVEAVGAETNGCSSNNSHLFRVSIAYPNDTAGGELTQFLNVVFGNTSLKSGIAVESVNLSPTLLSNREMFPGPRFGIHGLRALLGIPENDGDSSSSVPLLMTALKPMGKSSQEFADMAYHLARGGIDIIKDDHGLANQVWAPFEERVKLCAQAVQKANDETNQRCIYAPCLNAPASKVMERAYYAKQVGAGAVLVLPGISGFDVIRELAADDNFGLPILVHPALLGGWIQHHPTRSSTGQQPDHPAGLSHEFLFGMLPRLCGGDVVIFPNTGGRFPLTPQECLAVASGCRRPLDRFEPIFPCPAGGMKLERMPEMRDMFGDDAFFLIGGGLMEHGPDLELDAQAFRVSAGRAASCCVPHDTSITNEDTQSSNDETKLPTGESLRENVTG